MASHRRKTVSVCDEQREIPPRGMYDLLLLFGVRDEKKEKLGGRGNLNFDDWAAILFIVYKRKISAPSIYCAMCALKNPFSLLSPRC